nr:MAG TPA: hypothetical protein [Caudoviricetes sp.]
MLLVFFIIQSKTLIQLDIIIVNNITTVLYHIFIK